MLPVARFGELWPEAFSSGGRHWVLDNIHDGVLDEAAVQLGLDLDPAGHTVTVLQAHGSLRYHNLTINYFNGLPLLRQVEGTADFTGKELDFTPTGGVLKGLRVTGGALAGLTELGQHPEWLTVDLTVAGPALQDMLEVIDSKPLRYAHAIGVDPAHARGRAESQLHFKLPLVADLKLDAVDYAAKATITGASLDKLVLDRGIADGNLTLDIGRTGAHVQGTARLDDIPAKVDANIIFHAKNGPHATYRVGLTLDEEAQRRLALDFPPDRLKGPIAADITYTALPANRGQATAVLDLSGAALAISEAGAAKLAPRNTPDSQRSTLRNTVSRFSRSSSRPTTRLVPRRMRGFRPPIFMAHRTSERMSIGRRPGPLPQKYARTILSTTTPLARSVRGSIPTSSRPNRSKATRSSTSAVSLRWNVNRRSWRTPQSDAAQYRGAPRSHLSTARQLPAELWPEPFPPAPGLAWRRANTSGLRAA